MNYNGANNWQRSLYNAQFGPLLIVLFLIFARFLDLYLHHCLLLRLHLFFLHHNVHSRRSCHLALLLTMILLLQREQIQSELLLLFKFFLLLLLTDVRLEVFELILNGPLALLVVIDWLRYWLNRSVSDRYEYELFVFAFFFATNLLLLLRELPFEFCYPDFIFYNFLDFVSCSFSMFFFVLEAVF